MACCDRAVSSALSISSFRNRARVVGDHDASGFPAAWSARSFAARAEKSRATLSALVPAQVQAGDSVIELRL